MGSGSEIGPDIDLASFPVLHKGHKFEDFAEGQVWEHHWGRTLTAGENSLFSTALGNWNPLHLNREYATASGHPDTVINYMLVLCTVVGLSVEDLSESGGPFLSLDDCVFHRPVYPGDTLACRSEVTATRESHSWPGFGIVTWRTWASNQRDEIVVDFQRTNLVAKRRPA